MKKLLFLPLITTIVVWSTTVVANDSLFWIEKMMRSTKERNYTGTLVYIRDNQLQTLKIFHGFINGNEQQQLLSLDGENKKIIQNKSVVAYLLPGINFQWQLAYTHPDAKLKDFYKLFSSNYEMHMEGEARVAGFDVQILSIKPRDNHRYGYKLYLEKETALLMRFELINMDKQSSIEQMIFTDFQIVNDLEEVFPSVDLEMYSDLEVCQETLTKTNIMRNYEIIKLGYGFDLKAASNRNLLPQTDPITHLIYSDGIAAISVFIEPKSKAMTDSAFQIGATHTYSTIVADYQITLVGEVPAATLKNIIANLKTQLP